MKGTYTPGTYSATSAGFSSDVIIIGANYSGANCFRMASEKGARCIVLDSQPEEGFNSYGGDLGHFNSEWQEKVLGVPRDFFDPTDFIDSYQLQSASRAQPDLIRQFAHRNGEMVDWMTELYEDVTQIGSMVSVNFQGDNFLAPDAMDTTGMVLGPSRLELSFDVLTGLPGQTEGTLMETLGAVLRYGAGHISLYPLEMVPGTALCRRWEQEGAALQKNLRKRLPGDDEKAAMAQKAGQYLTAHGFREYLPRRWARPGRECRYFTLERENTEVLGCGLGAVTVLGGVRSKNTGDLGKYLRFSNRLDRIIDSIEPVRA